MPSMEGSSAGGLERRAGSRKFLGKRRGWARLVHATCAARLVRASVRGFRSDVRALGLPMYILVVTSLAGLRHWAPTAAETTKSSRGNSTAAPSYLLASFFSAHHWQYLILCLYLLDIFSHDLRSYCAYTPVNCWL